MALILARSPYLIYNQGFDDNASLSLDIGLLLLSWGIENVGQYVLNFRKQKYIDISPLIRDFLIDNNALNVRAVISGDINEVPQSDVVVVNIATDGYSYYEDGVQKDTKNPTNSKDFEDILSNELGFYAGSNNVVYRNEGKALNIPLLNPILSEFDGITTTLEEESKNLNNTLINYYKGTELVRTKTTDFGVYGAGTVLVTSERVQYITESTYDTFEERVEEDGGTYETSSCIEAFLEEYPDEYAYYPATRIQIVPRSDYSKAYDLSVYSVSECKYDSHRITFVNKFGVKEELWFFKKSIDSISKEKESFKANVFSSYVSGDLSKHSYRDYNVNARESMTLNTGFVPESFKENFKQLMLSESVWIEMDDLELPINIKNTELELKKSVNDKLINYTIDIEFSYDKINNIF